MTLEDRTQAIGRDLFDRLAHHRPRRLSRAWLDERLMGWTLHDERLKTQLFRFVDALPGLRSDAAIHAHLHEYLAPVVDRLPWPIGLILAQVHAHRRLWSLSALAARLGAHQLAHRFIVGEDVPTTIASVQRLRRHGRTATVDLLGEAILSEAEAEEYQHRYLALIPALAETLAAAPEVAAIDRDPAGPLPRANVSLKLSALTARFEPCDPVGTSARVRARLRPILRLARAHGAFINIDMEQSAYRGATYAIFRDVLQEDEFRDWPECGIAVQAYLTSTPQDLAELATWARTRGTPVWVRLVKGAYWDYETAIAIQNGWEPPVHTHKAATDAAYEQLAAFLIRERAHLRPAFASHNVRTLARVLALAEEARLAPRAIEFQMLYGMADELQAAMVERGERLRVYAPFGALLPGMAYLVRRLLENTSNQSFVRAGLLEHHPVEELLMDPAARPRPTAAPRTGGFANEPPLDFTLEAPRTAMAQALARARAQAPQRWPLVIGGAAVATEAWLEARNPSHIHLTLGWVARALPEHATAAVVAAAAAFPGWRETRVSTRADLLRRLAGELLQVRQELTALIVHETGKSWREADADLCEAVDFCRYYALEAERVLRATRVDLPGEENDWLYEPRGVTVVISPWNFPLAILTGMATAALAAGNPVVLKPAEQSSLIGAQLMAACQRAGFPPGVVNLITGIGEEVGPALLAHPATAVVAFTGSRAVGLSLVESAAKPLPDRDHLVRVIAELGGKNAILIDEDADLDEAVSGVLASAFGYQGQKCSACSRAIVLPGIYARFLERLVQAAAALPVAPAEDPVHGIGPLIDAEARARVRAAIERGRQEARLVFAGDAGALAEEGHYVPPHIFADVPEQSSLAQEEIFGPVLAVLRATDLTDALRIANGTVYALTGGCYSRSPQTLERVRREFRVGNLYLNRRTTGALVGRQPFGGFKLSGTGTKAGGPDYLLQFLLPRTITENTMRHGFAPERSSLASQGSSLPAGE